MKYLKLLSFLFITATSFGQQINTNDNTVFIGINRAFYGNGDIFGTVIYGEYSFRLNRYIDLSSRLLGGYAHRKELYDFEQTSFSVGTAIILKATPFPNTFSRFKFDFGAFYHRLLTKYDKLNSNYDITEAFGVVGSLRFNLIDTYKYEVGIRGDMFVSIGGECITCQTGIYGGLKF